MGLFKYLYTTSWNKIHQDIQEYKRLRQTEKTADKLMWEKYSQIKIDLGPQEYDITQTTNGCIVLCEQLLPDFGRDTVPMLLLRRSVCPYFKYKEFCNRSDCEFRTQQKQYVEAVVRYDLIKSECRNFWRKKFIASNTK